jgi:hypothetical protein
MNVSRALSAARGIVAAVLTVVATASHAVVYTGTFMGISTDWSATFLPPPDPGVVYTVSPSVGIFQFDLDTFTSYGGQAVTDWTEGGQGTSSLRFWNANGYMRSGGSYSIAYTFVDDGLQYLHLGIDPTDIYSSMGLTLAGSLGTFDDPTTFDPSRLIASESSISFQRRFGLGSIEITGLSVTAPVPEPETYALMLAGLGVVGAIARRRKAKTAA